MKVDLAVIGAGPGGYVAAIRAAQLGLKTVCIEKRKELGGTCLNVGCIPSKALLHSSEFYATLRRHGKELGIETKGLTSNFSQMMKRKEGIVSGFVQGIDGLFKKHKIEKIEGCAKLKSPEEIEVNGQIIEAKNILLATGSEPVELPFLPFDEKRILSSTGALSLSLVPKKLLIIGAGIIGVELGSVYQRLGSEVHLLEFLDTVCSALDHDLSKALEKSLSQQGMTFHLSHKVLEAKIGQSVQLITENPQGQQTFEGDAVLVCIGRKPASTDLQLDAVGIETDAKGFIPVDAHFRTSRPTIYAIGDLIDGPMLAHKASEEGVAVAEILAGHRPKIDYLAIPSVAYTSPEAASVGLTEKQARERGLSIQISRFPFKANSRARCASEEEGFVKLLCMKEDNRLVGAHIFGAHASELIAEAALGIRLKATALEIASTPHAHPTLAEAIKEAALALGSGPIHL